MTHTLNSKIRALPISPILLYRITVCSVDVFFRPEYNPNALNTNVKIRMPAKITIKPAPGAKLANKMEATVMMIASMNSLKDVGLIVCMVFNLYRLIYIALVGVTRCTNQR